MANTKSKIKSSNKNSQNLKERALEALKEVVDPEIGANIVDLGLIYDLTIDGNKVKVLMTLTSIGCPLGGFLIEEVESKLKEAGFENVEINLTFNPPWTPERMNKELRKRLGIQTFDKMWKIDLTAKNSLIKLSSIGLRQQTSAPINLPLIDSIISTKSK